MKRLLPTVANGKHALIVLAILGACWLSCVVYAASRSVWIERSAQFIAQQGASILPHRATDTSGRGIAWSPAPRAAWCFVASSPHAEDASWLDPFVRIASATPPWTSDQHSALLQAAILPFHALVCAAIVGALCNFGYPASQLSFASLLRTTGRVMWRSSWQAALWLAVAPFVAVLWTHASYPTIQPPLGVGVLAFPLINPTDENLEIIVWGALLGYLGSVSGVVRSQLWETAHASNLLTPSAEWTHRCHTCSYESGDVTRCPECGQRSPRSIGAVYWSKAHARLARNRRIDPVVAIWAGVVIAMLVWPLLSGLVFGRTIQ